MKTTFLTVGIGPKYHNYAQKINCLFQGLNKCSLRIVTSEDLSRLPALASPLWAKAFLWDFVPEETERICFVDADILPLIPLRPLSKAAFSATLDWPAKAVEKGWGNWDRVKNIKRYFNTGFFTATRTAIPVFEEMKKHCHEPCVGNTFLNEQTRMNELVQNLIPEGWDTEPNTTAFLAHYGNYKETPEMKMIHFAGNPKSVFESRLASLSIPEDQHFPSTVDFPDRENSPYKKIVIYAISKNEEKYIERFMSTASFADKIIVADTGSTDSTIEKLKTYSNVEVYDITVKPWRFDVARNISLDLVPEDTDICISLDLDEVLSEDWREQLEWAWLPGVNRVAYKYHWQMAPDGVTPLKTFPYGKIHARQGFEWRHPGHEYLYAKKDVKELWSSGQFSVSHFPDDTKSRSNYIDLLKMGVDEDPTDSRRAFYYGRELFNRGKHSEAINELRRYLTMPTSTFKGERGYAMKILAGAHTLLKNKEESIYWLQRAVTECPLEREHWLTLAEYQCDLENWPGAYFAINEALKITKPLASYIQEAESWGARPYDVLSVAAFHLGLKTVALQAITKALELDPTEKDYIDKKNKLERGFNPTPVMTAIKKQKCQVFF